MVHAVLPRIGELFSRWFSNPIFYKELRVSSRRRRNYWMRCLYIVSLGVLLLTVWQEAGGFRRGQASVTFLADAGMMLTASIVWFQFVALQILAVIYLSSSVSDEVYLRTLGVLMTTPLTSFNIVVGKLGSRLLQLGVVIAITLPILALIRVFGGIPWGFLWRGSLLTLCTTVFAGALSLLVSVFCRRAHTVIIVTLLILGTWWALVPLLAAIPGAVFELYEEAPWRRAFSFVHPYFNLAMMTDDLFWSRAVPWYGGWPWIIDAVLMLAASLVMMGAASHRLRSVGLSLVGAQPQTRKRASRHADQRPVKAARKSRPLVGCPILWKELQAPLLGRRPGLVKGLIVAAVGLLAILYLALAHDNDLDDLEVQFGFVVTLMGMACLFTMVVTATTVTSEREARSWPILLVTTVGHERILLGKWLGVLRRVLPAWAFFLGHLVLFTLLGYLHPWYSLHILIVTLGVTVFVTGSGLFFSAWCKRTTTAVVLSVMVPLAMWFLTPFLLLIVGEILYGSDDLMEACFELNPFYHIAVLVEGGVRDGFHGYAFRHIRRYFWIPNEFLLIWAVTLGHIACGVACAWIGKRYFLRHL